MHHLAGLFLATVVPVTFLGTASILVLLLSHVVGNIERIMPFVQALWSCSMLVMLATIFGYIGEVLLKFAHATTESACRWATGVVAPGRITQQCNAYSPTAMLLDVPRSKGQLFPYPTGQWSI
jgi:tellurite resistance protein TehA-like permease